MTDFSPVESVELTITLADGTTVPVRVADTPPVGMFWRIGDGVATPVKYRVLDLLDGIQLLVREFNANNGELHNVLELPR